jgi:copper chaperone CopZ
MGEPKTIRLKAEDIMCSGCAEDMKNLLREKEGIFGVSVSYQEGTIEIIYDPDATDAKQVYLDVRRLGFKTRVLSE